MYIRKIKELYAQFPKKCLYYFVKTFKKFNLELVFIKKTHTKI